jgi:hypothetical protein
MQAMTPCAGCASHYVPRCAISPIAQVVFEAGIHEVPQRKLWKYVCALSESALQYLLHPNADSHLKNAFVFAGRSSVNF